MIPLAPHRDRRRILKAPTTRPLFSSVDHGHPIALSADILLRGSRDGWGGLADRFHSLNRVAKIQSAGSLPRDCLVTDISDGGARLYAEGIVVPDQFVLLLTGSQVVRRECRVVWRLGNEIGVEFP